MIVGTTYRITLTDGTTYEAVVTPRAVFNFETKFNIGVVKAITDHGRFTHVYYMAWEAMKTSGLVVKPFEQWLDTVKNVEIVKEAPDPLDPAATPA